MEVADTVFENTHYQGEISSYLPGLKGHSSSSFTRICTLGCVLELILKYFFFFNLAQILPVFQRLLSGKTRTSGIQEVMHEREMQAKKFHYS